MNAHLSNVLQHDPVYQASVADALRRCNHGKLNVRTFNAIRLTLAQRALRRAQKKASGE